MKDQRQDHYSRRLAPCVSRIPLKDSWRVILFSGRRMRISPRIIVYYMSKAPRHLACYLGPPGWLRHKNCLAVKRSLHAEEARASWTQRFSLPSFPFVSLRCLSLSLSLCVSFLFSLYIFLKPSSCFDPRRSRDAHLLLIEPWMAQHRVARISEGIIDILKSKYRRIWNFNVTMKMQDWYHFRFQYCKTKRLKNFHKTRPVKTLKMRKFLENMNIWKSLNL